jgi:hypothetical protein
MYDVGTSLGSYLLATGAAEPVIDQTPARILPIEEGRRENTSAPLSPRGTVGDRWPRRP